MSNTKNKKLAASEIPEDSFNWSSGHTYGLDTLLDFSEQSEGGVNYSPQVATLSSLPGGFISEERDSDEPPFGPGYKSADLGADRAMDLRTFLAEDVNYRLPDLRWLELETELEKQDPERLPKNPVDLSIAELQEAWGVKRRASRYELVGDSFGGSGFSLTSNNIDLSYARSEDPLETPLKISDDTVRLVVRQASRRVASSVEWSSVVSEAKHLMQGEFYRIKKSMLALKNERGLLGKVYVRASAYPGCHNGEWTDIVNKESKTAKYVIKDSKCLDCSYAKSGSCQIFNRQLVSEVPWSKAEKEYASYFKNAGISYPSKGKPWERLRLAFGAKGEVYRPAVADKLTHDESKERADWSLQKNSFAQAHEDHAALKRLTASNKHRSVSEFLSAATEQGLITKKVARVLKKSNASLSQVRDVVSQLVSERGSQSRKYEGVQFYAVDSASKKFAAKSPYEQSISKIAKNAGVVPGEVHSLVSGVMSDMHSGLAGKALDRSLRVTYTKPLRKAASALIRSLRKAHEGLAGFLYVDAKSYAPEGVAGCEDGAKKHRGDEIPYVLKMGSCKSCVFKSREGFCMKYDKELVASFDDAEKSSYQNAMIEQSNAEFAPKTASLSAPIRDDAKEFGLCNSNLDNITAYPEPSEPQPSISFNDVNMPVNLWGE